MKKLFTLFLALLPCFMYSQTAMSKELLPDLSIARSAHIQLVPSAGKYVVVGGHINGFYMTTTAEIFNSGTNLWQGATANNNRDMGYVAKLDNGKYLIGGGCSSNLGVGQLASSEIYNPADNSFTVGPAMNVARTNACAATLKDGRVLVVGNWWITNTADYAEVYNPTNNSFTLTGKCLVARSLPIIIPTNDGGAIVGGGSGIKGGDPTDFVFEKYNPISNTFTELTRTLFGGETTWKIVNGQPSLTQQYLMPDGKYAVLVYNTDYTKVRLISIDPATSVISEIVTQKPIPLLDDENASITYTCSNTLMIDQTHKLLHIIQQASNNGDIILRIVTINLQTGSVNSSKMSGFNYSVASSNLSMLDDGRILFTGGNKFDNFTLSSSAFIIKPATYIETGIDNTQQTQPLKVRWDKQSQTLLFDEETNASLVNLNGKVLYKMEKSNKLYAPSLPAGLYIIQSKMDDKGLTRFLKVLIP